VQFLVTFDIPVGRAILPASGFQPAIGSRLKGGRSQDWLPHSLSSK